MLDWQEERHQEPKCRMDTYTKFRKYNSVEFQRILKSTKTLEELEVTPKWNFFNSSQITIRQTKSFFTKIIKAYANFLLEKSVFLWVRKSVSLGQHNWNTSKKRTLVSNRRVSYFQKKQFLQVYNSKDYKERIECFLQTNSKQRKNVCIKKENKMKGINIAVRNGFERGNFTNRNEWQSQTG